jgi:hypothetical protein
MIDIDHIISLAEVHKVMIGIVLDKSARKIAQ